MPQVGKLSLNPSLVSGSVCSIFLHKWPLLSRLSEALALSDTHCEAVNCRRRPLLGLAGAFSGHCEILRCTRQAWKLKHYTTLWWRHQSSVQCVLGILQRPALRSQCIHRALQVKFQPGKYPKRRWEPALCFQSPALKTCHGYISSLAHCSGGTEWLLIEVTAAVLMSVWVTAIRITPISTQDNLLSTHGFTLWLWLCFFPCFASCLKKTIADDVCSFTLRLYF